MENKTIFIHKYRYFTRPAIYYTAGCKCAPPFVTLFTDAYDLLAQKPNAPGELLVGGRD